MLRRISQYLWRATWLKCPVCGTRPLFLSWYRVRSLSDWFTPLDGCPRCGYAYDREPGYFLMAHWGLGYGVSAVVGILIYAYLQVFHSDLSFARTILLIILPLPFINLFFARHAKAYFLAIDHLADPHVSPDSDDGGDDGGGGSPPREPAPTDGPGESVTREREAEPAGKR